MVNYHQVLQDTRKVYDSKRTHTVQWRQSQLEAIIRMIDEQSEKLFDALKKDLRKERCESALMEVLFTRNEAIHALNHLDEWSQPQRVKKDFTTMMDNCFIRPEPLGVVLIMGAWNYPAQLILYPLVGAIAAGNCVILKPSEVSENTALVLEKIIGQYMDSEAIRVINGGIPETTALLKEKFDHIMYTGNSEVGKIVMQAAAKHLTPVTLELGGKSPCLIDKSSNLDIVVRRLLWGKFANAGQTCIAPDYVLCEKQVQDELVARCGAVITEFFGENPQKSKDFGRIVNSKHFNRVRKLIISSKVAVGGKMDEKDNFISPTIMANVTPDDPVMQTEVFGPLLPIMPVKDIDEGIAFVNSREKPLALYIFSKDDSVTDKIIASTSSGGLCVNDTVMHASLATLPFGGVGHSGMGGYHGKFTFDTFSHHRSCMIRQQAMESFNKIRYPPYTEQKLKWLSWLMKKNIQKKGFLRNFFPVVLIGVLIAFVLKMLGYPGANE